MRLFIFSAISLLSLALSAQDLHKEITVERSAETVHRDADRISVLPTLQLPPITRSQLTASGQVVSTRVPDVVSTLDPAPWTDPWLRSKQRGYVRLGIFPLYNADLSAGFKAVDTRATHLNLTGQYTGDIYRRGKHLDDTDAMWRDHTATIRADFTQLLGRDTRLGADVAYTYGYHNHWGADGELGELCGQSSSKADGSLWLSSSLQGLQWRLKVNAGHFGFYSVPLERYLPGQEGKGGARQNRGGFDLTGSLATGSDSHFTLDVDLDMLRTSRYVLASYPYTSNDFTGGSPFTSGLLTVHPRWERHSRKVSLTIGARMDICFKEGKALSFAPDVMAAWTPTQQFGLEIKATGGTVLNSLSEVYEGITPYINPFVAYRPSRIPLALEGRAVVGPFANVSLELFGGYAKANDWLMPGHTLGIACGGAVMNSIDIKGWRVGARASYAGNIVSGSLRWAMAPNNSTTAWYEWRDCARQVVEAAVDVRPIDRLSIGASFDLRARRRLYTYDLVYIQPFPAVYSTHADKLGTAASLGMHAEWRHTDRLSFFVEGTNLLGRTWQHIGFRPAQGMSALLGASYRF